MSCSSSWGQIFSFSFFITAVYIEEQGTLQESVSALCFELDLKEFPVGMIGSLSPLDDLIPGAFET